MRNAIATREAVFGAADQITAGGVTPTVEKIRERVGGGSYSTINKLLDEWFAQRRSDSAKSSDLPREITSLAQDLALKAATEIYVRVNESAAARVASAEAGAEERVTTAEDRASEAITEVDRLEAALNAAERENGELKTLVANAQMRVSSAEGQMAAQEREIARLGEGVNAAQAAQRSAEGEAERLRGQLVELREQMTQLTDRLAVKGGAK